MGSIAENLDRVRQAIAKAAECVGRDPGGIVLVAVSKTKPVELIKEAIEAGQMDFGENYAQELRDKMKEIQDPDVRWHYIGGLQKNKVKYVAGKAWMIHSIDRKELVEEIEKRAEKEADKSVCSTEADKRVCSTEFKVRALIEVNLGGEDSKSGVEPDHALELVKVVKNLSRIELCGLMTMPPFFEDPERARPFYLGLRELRDKIRGELGEPDALPELSMGLSHDFEVAIEEGATLVRVGTAIFGERKKD